ncbi:Transcriptional regulator, HxlR family [Alloactinosynnema sp. L-07]|uniref:winged helix-turn-helix transcriptional regulator n=1 Tax=Alloactinosynnema sp. L-07 TaxID=1653480 RepID=UPI00065EF42A|nr:helix-turn-helix domain-containing protein [Alloactinosynnema sp. L-07]CRK55802.1 Transcriptional regulator, HxlR family [Alloactinosynnema sp. L-07]
MIHPPDTPTALHPGGDNSIAYLIGVLADEWTMLILSHAVRGVDRFDQWLELLPITPSLLAGRLRRMTELGLVVPVDDRHLLTRRGVALWPLIVSVVAWEGDWGDDHAEPLPLLWHRPCGTQVKPRMACGTCGESVARQDVVGEFGPSGSWPRSAPSAATRRQPGGSASLGPAFYPHSRALIGNRWSAAMLGSIFLGATRFSQFHRQVGAPATVIADRLRVFREIGVLTATGEQDPPDRATFKLTEKGREFFPVVLSGLQWCREWFVAPEGPAIDFAHRGTDHRFTLRLVCPGCAEPLAGRDIEVTVQPG